MSTERAASPVHADPCNVCGGTALTLLYRTTSGRSLTSLSRFRSGNTSVSGCADCGHVQSSELDDAARFYADEYDILVASEDEDQLYEVRDGRAVYRTEHQVDGLRATLPLVPGARILDFGCAKSPTMRALAALRPDLAIHLFDVSDRYRPFWRRFVPESRCAVDLPPSGWTGSFDAVTSFFSLEHIARLADTLATIRALLAPGGRLYGIVPNVLTNVADLIVVDHVNHFTAASLATLCARAGLAVERIDADGYRGAFVFVAARRDDRVGGNDTAAGAAPVTAVARAALASRDASLAEAKAIASFWTGAGERIAAFEAALPQNAAVAIYGAGFYGAFIAAALAHPERVACVVDRNRHLQGTTFAGKPVVAPEDLPARVGTLLVGLNPRIAREAIAGVEAFAGRTLDCLYL